MDVAGCPGAVGGWRRGPTRGVGVGVGIGVDVGVSASVGVGEVDADDARGEENEEVSVGVHDGVL